MSVRPAPGFVLEVIGHPLGKLDGRWLVTRVEVSGDDQCRAPRTSPPSAPTSPSGPCG